MNFDLKNIKWEEFSTMAVDYGLKILGAILIIIVGFWLASKLSKLIGRQMEKTDLTISMRKFLQSLISIGFKILVLLVAMSTVGFEVTAFVALLGGLAVGVGLALQGSLSNLAGGILILLFKPFKVGDVIDSLDRIGTVEEISILQTILLTPDMRTVILPNGSVFNNPIMNYSKYGIRRVDVGIGISYDDDFDIAKEVLMDVLNNEPLILDDRDKIVEIKAFADSSVNLQMHGFTKTDDYWKTMWSLNKNAKKALEAAGLSIPYPQTDLHIIAPPNGNSKISVFEK